MENEVVQLIPSLMLYKGTDWRNRNRIYEKRVPYKIKGTRLNEVYLIVSVCLDDWEEIWALRRRKYYVKGTTIEEVKNNIYEYLEEKTLDFGIIYMEISMKQ